MLESQYKINLIKIGLKIAYYRKLSGMNLQNIADCPPVISHNSKVRTAIFVRL